MGVGKNEEMVFLSGGVNIIRQCTLCLSLTVSTQKSNRLKSLDSLFFSSFSASVFLVL